MLPSFPFPFQVFRVIFTVFAFQTAVSSLHFSANAKPPTLFALDKKYTVGCHFFADMMTIVIIHDSIGIYS